MARRGTGAYLQRVCPKLQRGRGRVIRPSLAYANRYGRGRLLRGLRWRKSADPSASRPRKRRAWRGARVRGRSRVSRRLRSERRVRAGPPSSGSARSGGCRSDRCGDRCAGTGSRLSPGSDRSRAHIRRSVPARCRTGRSRLWQSRCRRHRRSVPRPQHRERAVGCPEPKRSSTIRLSGPRGSNRAAEVSSFESEHAHRPR